jgi:hypothetical protein
MFLPTLARFAGRCAVVLAAAAAVRCGGSPMHPGDQPPSVSGIAPSSGPASGGTSVRITGQNFAQGATVNIGGVAATDVVVESPTAINAKTAAAAVGNADVTVTVNGRVGTLPGAFRFEQSGESPAIVSVTARGTRTNEPPGFADLDEEVVVSAVVQDADTPEDRLKFKWSADAGTFSGEGATVNWRAPADAPTPASITLNVEVRDDGGNAASGTTTVSLHNSVKEVGDLAREFLLDFSNSNNAPSFVVRNFSKGPRCERERDDEFSQIENNRVNYRIESSSIGPAEVSLKFVSVPCVWRPDHPIFGDACAVIPAAWSSLCLKTNSECTAGEHTHVEGLDYVTAVFEQTEWRLCGSQFRSKDNVARPNFIR